MCSLLLIASGLVALMFIGVVVAFIIALMIDAVVAYRRRRSIFYQLSRDYSAVKKRARK